MLRYTYSRFSLLYLYVYTHYRFMTMVKAIFICKYLYMCIHMFIYVWVCETHMYTCVYMCVHAHILYLQWKHYMHVCGYTHSFTFFTSRDCAHFEDAWTITVTIKKMRTAGMGECAAPGVIVPPQPASVVSLHMEAQSTVLRTSKSHECLHTGL